MQCWKTINVKKQYGFDRIFILSSLLVLAVFSIFYVALEMVSEKPLTDHFFFVFLAVFILIYPLHKAFHYLPLVKYRNELRVSFKKHMRFMPILSIFVKEPIPKSRFLFSLLAPFLFINGILLVGAFIFPSYGHYFVMLLAYHCGICLIDLLYVKNLARSPKQALIEETDNGYEILIPPTW